MSIDLRHADSLDVLPTLADGSVSAIVCDPPYGLEFMGAEWDSFKPSSARLRTRVDGRTNPKNGKSTTVTPEAYVAGPPFQLWCQSWAEECLRVLRPGGHLLAFGGARTSHRLAVAIEDAGFEIRDTITWLYGQGFPKSRDIGKDIDKAAGAEREVVGAGRWAGRESSADLGVMNDDAWQGGAQRTETAPATDAARQWQGWGTALKPASEPIIVARKPLAGTVAACVLEYGTGALNVDATRVGMSDADRAVIDNMGGFGRQGWTREDGTLRDTLDAAETSGPLPSVGAKAHAQGRWPANVVLTHGPDCADPCQPGCPVAELDAQSGTSTSARSVRLRPGADAGNGQTLNSYKIHADNVGGFDDQGGASRFFPVFRYQAKAPTKERPKIDGQGWPTVKPLALMRWLVRLVTPPGGLVLDPFAGTGTTLQASELEGFDSLGIERDPHAYALACQRLGIEAVA